MLEIKSMNGEIRYDSNRVRLRTGEYEKGNGKYEYRYTVFGKLFSVYAKTLEELREKEEQIFSQKAKRDKKHNQYRTTLNDVFELWKELKRGIRANTFVNYCYLYEHYIQDSIGRRYISTIKKSDVKRFFNYLADERRLKAGTLDGVQNVLHQVLQIAVNDEWIMGNPADNALKELKRAHNLHTKKRIALTRAEQLLLIEFLSKNDFNSRWYPITVILLGTGMRVGEATGLRWCDVDFENNWIDANHTLIYGRGKGECAFAVNDTKTPASKRLIPMTEQVKMAFLKEKQIQEEMSVVCEVEVDGYTDFVFVNRFGDNMK